MNKITYSAAYRILAVSNETIFDELYGAEAENDWAADLKIAVDNDLAHFDIVDRRWYPTDLYIASMDIFSEEPTDE